MGLLERSPALWFLKGAEWSDLGKSAESTCWCRSVWGGQVQISGWVRGVDTPWWQARIDLHSCLPCLPSERHVPEAGVTGRFMSQLLNHQSPQCSVLWEVALTWGHAVKLHCKLQLRRSWFTSLSSLSDETFRNYFCLFPSSSVVHGSTWNQDSNAPAEAEEDASVRLLEQRCFFSLV